MSDGYTARHVTWDEVQRVLLYCQRVRAMLRILHWDVAISVDPESDGAHAGIQTAHGRYFATLYLHETWMEKSIATKRSVLMHEMLHLLHIQQEWALRDQICDKTDLSEDRSQQIMHSYSTATELMVDHLATTFIRLGHQPNWPTIKAARAAGLTNTEP